MSDINIVINSLGRSIEDVAPNPRKTAVRLWQSEYNPENAVFPFYGEIFNDDQENNKSVEFSIEIHKFGHPTLTVLLKDEAAATITSPIAISKGSSKMFKMDYGTLSDTGSPLAQVIIKIREEGADDWEDAFRLVFAKAVTTITDLDRDFGQFLYDPGVWYDITAENRDKKIKEMIKEEEENFWLSVDLKDSLSGDYLQLLKQYIGLQVALRIFTKAVSNMLGGENWHLRFISQVLKPGIKEVKFKLGLRFNLLAVNKLDLSDV